MNVKGYLIIFVILIGVAVLWGLRKKKQVSVGDFWNEKEKEYGEKKILSTFARYLGGHARYDSMTEGLLFLMSKSLWFENFEKGPSVFGFTFPFEKVVFRIPLSRIIRISTISEKDLLQRGFAGHNLNMRRINRKPEYLMVLYLNEWGREKELILDSMIEITQWHQAIAEAKKNYVPEEAVDTMGACPKCGKKMTPDFKLCPYCGCRLS